MKKLRVRTLVVCLAITLMLVPPARAFLGFGDIVFDPTNFEQAVRQLLQMEQQYLQLVQTYRLLNEQYDHVRRMAQQVPVDMRTRYRALPTEWRSSNATNTFGTTGAWIASVNKGIGIAEAYDRAIERLEKYGSGFQNIPSDQQDRVKSTYATVELTDGAAQSAMDTIGRLRANAPNVERAIQGLEDDSLSSDPAMNTEIAVLNKINAAGLVANRNAQDTNKLLVALTEQQTVQAKRIRDAEARAINQHIRFVAEGRTAITSQISGTSAAMANWRMP